MSALTDFLLARIAEDEAVAKAATAGPWRVETYWFGEDPQSDVLAAEVRVTSDQINHEDAEHIARHDPDRVIAKCKAYRLVVELCAVDYEDSRTSGDDDTTLAEEVLHALALPYFDHPDYAEATR